MCTVVDMDITFWLILFFFYPVLISIPAGFSNLHVFHREKRSTMAEIVEQLQEREAAQVCFFVYTFYSV